MKYEKKEFDCGEYSVPRASLIEMSDIFFQLIVETMHLIFQSSSLNNLFGQIQFNRSTHK